MKMFSPPCVCLVSRRTFLPVHNFFLRYFFSIEFSVPNRPVCPALGTAGLTQAFSETAGPDYGKPAFQKRKPGSAWVTCRPQVFNPNLNPQKVISID